MHGTTAAILLLPLGSSSIDLEISMEDMYRPREKKKKSILNKALQLDYLPNLQATAKPLKILILYN